MASRYIRILVINPNSSQSMTNALQPVVTSLGYENVQFEYFTCPNIPGSVPSINSPADAIASAEACWSSLECLISHFDGFLVACYSLHPLVDKLKIEIRSRRMTPRDRSQHVTGIFEASVNASLSVCQTQGIDHYGIVSTGKVWERALDDAVASFLNTNRSSHDDKYIGCETTELNANELHDLPAEDVRVRMKAAVGRLFDRASNLGGNLRVICLGCAGMVGLEEVVRETAIERQPASGHQLAIVDGVKVGVGQLVSLIRASV